MTLTHELTPEQLALIELTLQSQLGSQVRDLRLFVHDDGLVLRGTTRTYYARLLVQEGVMTATDVPIAANEIEVC